MSSYFSESRDPSYVSLAMYPKCLRKEWRTKSFRLQSIPTGSGRKFVQGPGGVTTSPTLHVSSWGGASRTIWNCCWSWSISGPPRTAAPATLHKGKLGTKMSKWIWVCRPTLNLFIYEIVFSLFAKSECRIQIIIQFFKGVLGTRFGSLDLKIGSLESEKIIKGNIYEI